MGKARSDASLVRRLRLAGLRPTRQRVELARILFTQPHRHVTADELYAAARERAIDVSLATIYNTLNQFTGAGLLRELTLSPGCSYFDTNTGSHHHFFYEDEGRLVDIPEAEVVLSGLPTAPAGSVVRRVDVIIRVGGSGSESQPVETPAKS